LYKTFSEVFQNSITIQNSVFHQVYALLFQQSQSKDDSQAADRVWLSVTHAHS